MCCCLLGGTVVFTRWHQCAHPTNILFLEPARVSPLNGILIGSAVFGQPTPGWYVCMVHCQEAPISIHNSCMWFFGRTRVCPANSTSVGPVMLRCSMCITMPNIVKIGWTVAIGLQDGGHLPSWIFKNLKVLTVDRLERVRMYHCTKFYGILSNRCWHGDFPFFNMAAICHLRFLKIQNFNSW